MPARSSEWRWPVFAGAATCAFLFLGSAGVQSHSDAIRDLLLARDCSELGVCHTAGASTTVRGIGQGGTWIAVLSVLQLLGASPRTIQLFVVLLQGLAVTLLARVTERALSPSVSRAAVLAYVAALWLVDDPSILWNPSLLPLFVLSSSLGCFLGARTGRSEPLVVAGFMAGVAISLHPVCAALLPALVFLIGAGAQRPILTAGLCLAAAAAPLALTSWDALLQSVRYLGIGSNWLVPAALALGSTLAGVARRKVWRRLDEGKRDLFTALLLILPITLGGLGRTFLGGHFVAYYAHPAVPAASVALGALGVRFLSTRQTYTKRVVAAALLVLTLLNLGRWTLGPVSAWQLADAKPIASQIFSRSSRSWEDLARSVEAIDCYALTSILALQSPVPGATASADSRALQVLLVRDAETTLARGRGFDLVPLPGGAAAAVRFFESALDRSAGRVCLEGGAEGRTCQALVNADSKLGGGSDFRFRSRAYPEVHSLLRGEPYTVEYRFGLASRNAPVTVSMLEEEGCPWQISEVDGAAFAGTLPASSAVLPAGPAGGTITFRKRYDAATCSSQSIDRRFPPCLLETSAGEGDLIALSRRRR